MSKVTYGETQKCYEQRLKAGTFDKYLNGNGIDIGCGNDLLDVLRGTVRAWDEKDGNAQDMKGVDDNHFDFIYSSHCLEHVNDPFKALQNWVRICKLGGFIYVVVPDFELYEKKRIPSIHNKHHKHFFSMDKYIKVIKLPEFFKGLDIEVIKLWLNDTGYDHSPKMARIDQTKGWACAQIEFILKKIGIA